MGLLTYARFGIEHGAWALGRLIDSAAALPAADLERDLGIGPGSFRENLAHTIEAMYFFADNFAGREFVEPDRLAERSRTLEGLRSLLDEAHARLRDSMLVSLSTGPGNGQVYWPNAPSGSMSTAAAVAQVFDHAVLHRTQCVNMLKRLGVSPVPDLDPMTFEQSGLLDRHIQI